MKEDIKEILIIPKHVEMAFKSLDISYQDLGLAITTNNTATLKDMLEVRMSKIDTADMLKISKSFIDKLNSKSSLFSKVDIGNRTLSMSNEDMRVMIKDYDFTEEEVKESPISMSNKNLFSNEYDDLLKILIVDDVIFLFPTDKYLYMLENRTLQAITIFYRLYTNLKASTSSIDETARLSYFKKFINFTFNHI